MDGIYLLRTLFMTLYTFALVMVAVYGLHRWALLTQETQPEDDDSPGG